MPDVAIPKGNANSIILSHRRESMQRAAGTSRMVPDPQTAKGESGTKVIQHKRFPALSPLESP